MSIEFPPPYDDLTFLTPLSEERAARLVAFLTGARPVRVLDVGCGWGELLIRVLEAAPQALGLGLDLDEDSVEQARARAVRRDVAHRVDFEARDARRAGGPFDAVTCIGASQIWGPPVEANEPLAYEAALSALRELVPRGGRVVYGEGFWSRPPTPEATAPLAGRDDEYVDLGTLVALAATHGFAIEAVHEASQDEWDVFESGFAAAYARWLAAHDPDDPDAVQVRDLAMRQRSGYYGGYRGVLGLAYLHLLAV